ncbi:hypothetical protein ACFYM5_08825 [Streptomyces sp. NPDC006706]|uniref:hypothetical protein n=1 Tax=Streptomyces sp. NPDC006706 TaxID=3364761 RepID=UPI003694F997
MVALDHGPADVHGGAALWPFVVNTWTAIAGPVQFTKSIRRVETRPDVRASRSGLPENFGLENEGVSRPAPECHSRAGYEGQPRSTRFLASVSVPGRLCHERR